MPLFAADLPDLPVWCPRCRWAGASRDAAVLRPAGVLTCPQCRRSDALVERLRVLDLTGGPQGLRLLDGRGGLLPTGAEPVYLDYWPGRPNSNSRGEEFTPVPSLDVDAQPNHVAGG